MEYAKKVSVLGQNDSVKMVRSAEGFILKLDNSELAALLEYKGILVDVGGINVLVHIPLMGLI